MAWRIEWTGGTAEGVAPVGWRRCAGFDEAKACALGASKADGGIDLRVVLLATVDESDVDVDAVFPSVATLITWSKGSDLPAPSRHALAARQDSGEHCRLATAAGLRRVLDHAVEAGTLSRIGAARVVAALETEMIRSLSCREA